MSASEAAMDVATLVATLQKAIRPDRILPFTGGLAGSADLDALLGTCFEGGTVAFGDARASQSVDGASAVVSGVVTQGSLACQASLILTPGAGDTALRLTLTAPAAWSLPQPFPGVLDPTMSGLKLAGGAIVVSSAPFTEPSQQVPLQRGMSVVASLEVAASFPCLAPLVGSAPIAIHGMVSDPAVPLLTLETVAVPASLGTVELADVSLRLELTNLADPGQPPIAAASAELSATLSLGKGVSGTVTAALPADGSGLALDVTFVNATLSSLELLQPFIGGADLLASLPVDVAQALRKAGSAFGLSRLSLAFDSRTCAFRSAGVVVDVKLGGFRPFDALSTVEIDDLAIAWQWDATGATAVTTFSAETVLELAPGWNVGLGFQTQPAGGYLLTIRKAGDAPLRLAQLVSVFFPGLPLPELDVEDFSISLWPHEGVYTLTATIDGAWQVLQRLGLELATVTVEAQYRKGMAPFPAGALGGIPGDDQAVLSGSVSGRLTFDLPTGTAQGSPAPADDPEKVDPSGQIDLLLTAVRPPSGEGWQLSGELGQDQVVPIGDLIQALASKLGVPSAIPAPLRDLTLQNLELSLDTATEAFKFGCRVDFPVEDTTVELVLAVDVGKDEAGCREIDFGGSLLVGGLEFDVEIQKTSGENEGHSVLLAEYSAHGKSGEVKVRDLIGDILPGLAEELPPDLALELNDAVLAFVDGGSGRKKLLFAMDVALEFPLSDLPLVGKALPADATAGIRKLKLVVTSAPLSAEEVTLVNGLSPVPVLPAPAPEASGDAIPKGLSVAAELQLGGLTLLLTSPKSPPTALAVQAPNDGSAPSVTWVEVQKTIGPVSIQKVGFSYRDGRLYVVSNLALSTGPLEIDLLGIGMGSPISKPDLRFTIDGLGVSYVAGPVSVMGGLLGTLEPVAFDGVLSIRTPELAVAALGAYAEYQGHPSFFLYAVVDAALGGPPAFFVTGVAVGLGFNRKLLVPEVAGVEGFPLVKWARGDGKPSMDPGKPAGGQVADVLSRLAQSGVVSPSVGDYWFAAGVRFTSFELVDSFALVTLSAGTDVEVCLLGLSTLTVPPKTDDPVAEVQLALEVSFSYDKGRIAVAGQLTQNSYVLSHSCHLTGGFAFYLWFKGEHAGDTVLTLGGYNPAFTVPEHFPVVPRLGLSWQVVPPLSITGGLYFAVTPNVIMAGGKLSAVWHSGPISAWFTYWADFQMTFKPFHYYVDGGIDLGASFTIDLWLFSVSVTIHVGVDLALWGPEFAGRATVDLSIISFTISFNDQNQRTDTTIPWGDFVAQLLPKQQPAPTLGAVRRGRSVAAGSLGALGDPAVVQINPSGGLVRELPPTADGPCYLVSSETFSCAVLIAIPAKAVVLLSDPEQPELENLSWAPDDQQPGKGGVPTPVNVDFGAGPAGIAPEDFQPRLTLTLSSPADSLLHAVRRLGSAPKALWENKDFDEHGIPRVDPQTALKEGSISNALVGLTLAPFVKPPDVTLAVPLESLLFTLDDDAQPFAWSAGAAPTSDPFGSETVTGTIGAPAVKSVRDRLLGALAAQGVSVSTAVDVSALADPARNDLEAAPRLRLLGEHGIQA